MALEFELRLADMVFINYIVEPDRVRPILPVGIRLDSRAGEDRAWVSLVSFRTVGVAVSGLRIPSAAYSQLNCRVYVRSNDGPAVFFMAIRPGSFIAAAGARLLGVPARRSRIKIIRARSAEARQEVQTRFIDESSHAPLSRGGKLSSTWPGVTRRGIEVKADGLIAAVEATDALAPDSAFITERPIGYVAGRGGRILSITAVHNRLLAQQALIERISAPVLRNIGLVDPIDEPSPESVYYVEEALMRSSVRKADPDDSFDNVEPSRPMKSAANDRNGFRI